MPYLSIGVLETRRDAKVKQLQNISSLMQGSISTVKTTCGKVNCKCARGIKHESNILTKKVNGKTKTIYIPKAYPMGNEELLIILSLYVCKSLLFLNSYVPTNLEFL